MKGLRPSTLGRPRVTLDVAYDGAPSRLAVFCDIAQYGLQQPDRPREALGPGGEPQVGRERLKPVVRMTAHCRPNKARAKAPTPASSDALSRWTGAAGFNLSTSVRAGPARRQRLRPSWLSPPHLPG